MIASVDQPLTWQPVLVACCGNPLSGDDAFGPLVAKRLSERGGAPAAGIELIDLGMKPAGLAPHLAGRVAAIVIDAAEPGPLAAPGTLVDAPFDDELRPRLRHDRALSSHGLSIVHELELARALGLLPPRVWLLAAVGEHFTLGAPPSERMRQLADRAAARVAELASQWRRETQRPSALDLVADHA